jgi:hypothetical protein
MISLRFAQRLCAVVLTPDFKVARVVHARPPAFLLGVALDKRAVGLLSISSQK